MHRLLTTTAVALLLGVAPALAIDDSAKDQSNALPEASQSNDSSSTLPSEPGLTPDASEPGQPQAANEPKEGQRGQLPTQPGVSPDVAKQAHEPDNGSADMSGGARERSSAPPESGAASAGTGSTSDAQSSDVSSGAKEQSSAPDGSSAADQSKPNPTMGPETSRE